VRKPIILTVLAALLILVQLLVNCADPLEGLDDDGLSPLGPITETDTVFETDTLIIDGDTVYSVDTVIVSDTITYVDTVTIYEPEPGTIQVVCSILLANLREIIWTFHNEAGLYQLEFEATPEREFCFYKLIVDIDGQEFVWDPTDGNIFTQELTLSENATIRVTPDKPLLLGHQVDICLAISKPQ